MTDGLRAEIAQTASGTATALRDAWLRRFAVAALVLVATAAWSTARAQSVQDNEISACAAVDSVADRLLCFDGLTERHGLAATSAATKEPTKGEWVTGTSVDPMTDAAVYSASLPFRVSNGRVPKIVVLLVRCKNNKTEMLIDWNSYLGNSEVPTTFRVDKEAAKTTRWSISTNNRAAFYPSSPVSLLKKMADGTSFVASVTPYGESPVTAVFNISGAAAALADVRKGCGW